MATRPSYFSTVCVGRASLSTANTNRDGTGTLVTPTWGGGGVPSAPQTGPATDWALNRIVIAQTGDLADCVITVFTFDGTTTSFLTDIDIGNPTAGSTTASGLVLDVPFVEYRFPAGWDLRFGLTVAPTSGLAVVTAFAERA